ncbi:poly(ADP-ribose) glycohydrolase 1 isoform X2 [Gossypium hirsutum]|uniref:poly(ADP-ribose) glycohydrolase n=1 Tax=Gossypium hirsutum TaxID=3635 RepID=A0ABM2ZX94_GOSHI|nr:poly(ADP-ribose) glycohydrolase 1-like isoform X2 [Gossypium hirsutum]
MDTVSASWVRSNLAWCFSPRSLYDSYSESQENKVRCIICYFQRICLQMPTGSVLFELKLLSLEYHPWQSFLSYPYADFWTKSNIPLCPFQVHSSGLIEDHAIEALEVDFANKYLGGGALHRGCVQVIYRLGRIGATESHGDHEFVNYFK